MIAKRAENQTDERQNADKALQRRHKNINGRKYAEEKIRKEKEFTANLLKGLKDGFAVIDQQGKQILVNDELCKMTGYSENELLNQYPPYKYWAEEGLKEIYKVFENSIKGIEGEYELTFKRKDGERFIALVSPWKTTDPDGNAIFFATVKDITDRKQAEEKLRLFRNLIDQSNDAIFVDDPETGRILDVNDKACSNLGYTREELLNMRVFDIEAILPDHFSWEEHVKEIKEKGYLLIEGRHRRKDGTTFPVEVNVNIIIIRKNSYMVAVARDITERKRAEEELRKSEEKYRDLFENANDAICIVDSDLNYKDANKKAVELFGYSRKELLNMNILDIIPPEQIPRSEIEFDRLRKTGSYEKFVGKARTRDGCNIDVEISSSAIRDGDKIIGSRDIIRDITENKRMEEALRESEEKYRALMDDAYDAILLVDSEGNLRGVNKRAKELLGYTEQESLNMHITQIHPREELGRSITTFKKIIQNGSGFLNDVLILRKDGTTVPVDITGNIIKYADRRVVQEILRDVTERKRTEEKLKESEGRYRKLVELSPDAIAIHSGGKIVFLNNAGAKLLGAENPEQLTGREIMDFVHPNYRRIVKERIRQMKEEGKSVPPTVEKFIRLDGSVIDVEVAAMPFTYKDKLGMQVIIHDITERKHAEEELLKFKLGIEKSDEAIFITGIDGTIVYVNPAFEKIYGFSREEALGKTPRILKSGLLPPEAYKQFWDTILAKKVVSGELINKTRGGRILTIDGSANPILNEDVNIIGFLAIQRDITEKKNIEKVRHENERLTLANKAKSEFLATMSHELRTPLNSVIGFSELLRQKIPGELNEKQMHYVGNIHASGKHLLNLINDILDLSRVEAGKIEIIIEKVSVPDIIDEVISLFNEKALRNGLILKKELDPQLDYIEADRQRIKQILFNLLSNAVKFSKPEGGTITVTARREEDMALISVSDTGIGIREEDMGRLFKEFEQLDTGVNRRYGGTGLGLAISKKLIELQGGKIMVESKYGEGSIFTFSLPLTAKGRIE